MDFLVGQMSDSKTKLDIYPSGFCGRHLSIKNACFVAETADRIKRAIYLCHKHFALELVSGA